MCAGLKMAETLSWSYSVHATGGPSVSSAADLAVSGYEKFTVPLPAGGGATVDAVPGDATVNLVVLDASPADPKITYDAGGGAKALDAPLVLIGPGAVGLLGTPFPKLAFSNGSAKDASVQVLIGRSA
jgi:hypothetical protein